MTTGELQTELYELLGRHSQLNPSNANGASRLTRFLNLAQDRVAFFKFPDGHLIRFETLERDIFFKTVITTGDAQGGGDDTITLASGAGGVADRYNGWIVECNDEKKFIVDYDGGLKECTLHEDWDTNPSNGDSYTLYKNFHRFVASGDNFAADNTVLDPVTDFYTIQKVERLADGVVLSAGYRDDTFVGSLTTYGKPSEYKFRGDKMIFDVASEETEWYRMFYVRPPTPLVSTETSEGPELGRAWHMAILLKALWYGHRWAQEPKLAWSANQDFKEAMATTRQEVEMSMDMEDPGVVVEV